VRQLSSAPAEAIDQRLQQEHSSLSGRNLAASFSRSGRAPGGAIEEELQQKLVEQSNQSAASAKTVEIRPKQSSSGFSTSVPQHKRAWAQVSAEACRAKYSISGFSRNIQDPSEAIDQRPQHKRDSAQASAEDCRAKQSISGFSRNSRDPKQLSIGLSTSVLPRKRQQKLVERSNRQAASAETVEFHPKQSIGGFSTSVIQHKR